MDANPIHNAYLTNTKAVCFVALEMVHNIMFHFIETVKVRGMARNLRSGDYSKYFENKVINKRKSTLPKFTDFM